MNEWKVRDKNTGEEWHKDNRQQCEEAIEEFGGVKDLEIVPPEGETDGGQKEAEQAPPPEPQEVPETVPADNQVPESKPTVDQDPVDWLPGHFIDKIQGVPTVNRKGYAVIASQYNVAVAAQAVTRASETDFEYAEFRAVAKTEDGREYTGFGSAHVDRMDGDDKHLLNELAETRAMKRATAWATGIGITAIEEMKGEL